MDLKQAPPVGQKALGVDVAGFAALKYDGARLQAPIEAIETAPHGVWGGDPKHCSAETGKALSERLVRIGAGFIRDHVATGFKG